MKQLFLIVFLLASTFVIAQTFIPVPPIIPFEGISSGSFAFADIDGDNDEDVIIAGNIAFPGKIAKLYTNDGDGSFTEVEGTPFATITSPHVVFADIDGDNDPDLLIAGQSSSSLDFTKLYTNDGNGNFTELVDTGIEQLYRGSVSFSDIDGDNDLDLLMAGIKSFGGFGFTKLYRNDASVFTEVMDIPFVDVKNCSTAFADIDGDGDEDLIISGKEFAGPITTKLYINEDGNFVEEPDAPFIDLENSHAIFADVDNDNDPDFLIKGKNNIGIQFMKLYTNENGVFTEEPTSFEGAGSGHISLADVDQDDDLDVLVTGTNTEDDPTTKLYINDNFSFSEVLDLPFDPIFQGAAKFNDADNDGAPDVLLIGNNYNYNTVVKMYKNNNGTFTKVHPMGIEEVENSATAFADVDNDNDLDLVITGRGEDGPVGALYSNENGIFTEVINTPFAHVSDGMVAFGDVDGDTDPDLLIAGNPGQFTPITKFYLNHEGTFTEVEDIPFIGLRNGVALFEDVDGDNDIDLFISGRNVSFTPTTKLYINDGEGVFTENTSSDFQGLAYSAAAFADIDLDGDPDLVICGGGSGSLPSPPTTMLYRNNGGTFTEVIDVPFLGVQYGSVSFSDINNDDYPDLLITGRNEIETQISKFYINNGGTFSSQSMPFARLEHSDVAFTDIDFDDDPDLIMIGGSDIFGETSELYLNENGAYVTVMDVPFEPVSMGAVNFADIDGDNDPDLLITGKNSENDPTARLYINTTLTSSTEPITPDKNPISILYPNPSISGLVTLQYESIKNANLQVSTFDLTGKRIFEQSVQVFTGPNTITLDHNLFAKGTYVIQLFDGIHKAALKLIIQ